MSPINIFATVGLLILGVWVLIVGKAILIPALLGVIFWYTILTFSTEIRKIKLFSKQMPIWLSTALAFLILAAAVTGVALLVNVNVQSIVKSAPLYEVRFEAILERFFDRVGLPEDTSLAQLLQSFDASSAIKSLVGAVTSLAGSASLIFLYTIFLLIEAPLFHRKLKKIFTDKDQFAKIEDNLGRIGDSLETYFKIKFSLGFLTALLSYLAMALMGLDFALFWALLIFILNFIPNIGSLLGVLLPTVFALIQFGESGMVILVFALLMIIQILIDNVIQPRMVGQSLNLSPTVILLALVFWGQIWGIVGMLLCVPLMVMVNLVLAQFPKTRALALMLSSKGEVKTFR